MDDSRTLSARLSETVRSLGHADVEGLTDRELVDTLATLERLKGAAAAAQVRLAVALDDSQRRADAARGARPEVRGRGTAAHVALAMRTSPSRGRRFLGLARALGELPHTYDALAAGETSEHRALLVARETAHLTREHRGAVDAELAARPGGIGALGDRSAEGAARAVAQRLDPAGACRRNVAAVKDRRVSLRPAPDGMTRLSAVLSLTDGVATYAALDRAAGSARAAGDERSRGAVMADELVARVAAGAAAPTSRDVELCLVMTDAALLGSDDPDAHHEPVQVHSRTGSHGTVPADVARGLVRDADRVWLRRLYRDPGTGELVATETRSRLFSAGLRRLVVLRDQQCRTPWCDGPVRHVDHVARWRHGGPTSLANAQGLCEACNHAKEAAGLRQAVAPDCSVSTTTSTGHAYRSPPARAPGLPPPRVEWSAHERWVLERLPA